MRAIQKTTGLFALLFACTCVLVSACGGDSSSSGTPEDPEEDVHPAKEAGVDNKVSDSKVTKDKIYDSSIGSYLNTVQFGMYIWLEDNATESGSYGNTMCYNDDPDNCYAYGRMYHPGYGRCPSGFSVPTKDDWSGTMAYISKYPEVASSFGFSMGGYCYEGLHGVDCTDLDKTGYYLAGDNTIAIVKGRSVSFRPADEENFYQLRCLKYTYLVATVEDLPHCDSITRSTLQPFYVMSEKTNYKCSGTRWVDDFSNSCGSSENGMSAVYNDTMYICKFREWQVADISDSKDACTDENDRTTYLFNGNLYACEDGAWRSLKNLELKLGYCRPSMIGTLDSLETTTSASQSNYYSNEVRPYDSYAFYACDSTGWRTALLSDYMGKCDSTREFKEGELHEVRYVCRKGVWDTFTKLESEIGVCSPKKQGVIDTTESEVAYICDETSWRTATKYDYLGDCVPKVENKILPYGGDKYICLEDGWYKMNNLEVDMGLCTEKRDGEIDSTESGYAYICDGGWREVKAVDIGGVCDSTKNLKIVNVNSRKYYCFSSSWNTLNSLDEEIGFCTASNKGKKASTKSGSTYYCEENGWRIMDRYEVLLGICTSSMEGTTKKNVDTVFVCTSGSWKKAGTDIVLGTCDSKSSGVTKTYLGTVYGCRENKWVVPDSLDKLLGFCAGNNSREVVLSGDTYYRCNSHNWVAISAVIGALGTCNEENYDKYKKGSDGIMYACHSTSISWTRVDNMYLFYGDCVASKDGERVVFNNEEYVCDIKTSTGWKKLDSLDKAHGTYCGYSSVGDTVTYHGVHYVCKAQSYAYKWQKATDREYMGYCTAAREGHTMFNGANTSKCTGQKWVGVKKTFTDSRDSKKYNYVTIDGLDFMSQNLNYAGVDSTICISSSTATNCDEWGRLYSPSTAAKACPSGWRLPDSTELHDMLTNLYNLNKFYAFYGDGWNLMPYPTAAFTDTTGWHDEDLYGLNITPTGYEIAYLQNGMDPMRSRMADNMSVFYWTASGDYWGRGRPFGFYESTQYQSVRVIGMAIRCVR